MTRFDAEANTEEEEVQEYEEEEAGGSGDYEPWLQSNTSFLPELNLVIVLLSMFSMSSSSSSPGEDEYVEREPEHTKRGEEAKACISRLPNRRQVLHKPEIGGSRAQKFHPIFKDCRHGRRM